MKDPIHKHFFRFNKGGLDSENLFLETSFIPNGDPGVVFTNQKLTLQSYGNSASFNLCGIQITPEILRKLADEMDSARAKAIKQLKIEQEREKESKLNDEEEMERISTLLKTEDGRNQLAQEMVPIITRSISNPNHPYYLKSLKTQDQCI